MISYMNLYFTSKESIEVVEVDIATVIFVLILKKSNVPLLLEFVSIVINKIALDSFILF